MKKFLVVLVIFLCVGYFAVRAIDAGLKKKAAGPEASYKGDIMAAPPTLSGKVLHSMNGAGYTYVLIDRKGEKIWVAIPKTKIVLGTTINLIPGTLMRNFESRSLHRTFDSIVFSAGLIKKGSLQAGKSTHGKGVASATVVNAPLKKAKGPDAYTIAEIYKKLKSLDGHRVVVRGKVVKISTGFKGKNWLHLEDGSGNPGPALRYFIVATSKELPKLGQVVTASGTLAENKDFGKGYKFRAIIEGATLGSK